MKDFKIYLQHDAMQCGTACLRMICSYYGADYSFDTSEGVSLLGISEATEKQDCIRYADVSASTIWQKLRCRAYCTGTRTTLWCCIRST